MPLNIGQLSKHIVKPVLKELGMYSLEAEQLVIGTGLVESGLQWLHQINGVAYGIYQCEPKTLQDIYENYLAYRRDTFEKIVHMMNGMDELEQLHGNLYYATAICRLHYRRAPEKLPTTPEGMADYHKKYYNSVLGKTDPKHSVNHFKRAMENVY